MKKISLLFIALLFLGSIQAQDAPKRVLFIGNSYTEVNNLPQLVGRVCESAGRRIDYSANTPGGCTFSQHCNNQSMTMIQEGNWDFVVLQEQSQYPSFPIGQVQNECFPYAQQLVEAVYQYNPDGEPMFYMTWGRENGDSYNAQFYPPLATYEGMDSLLYERYMYMARTFDASVCPVGRVWRHIRTNHPEIGLYSGDGSHPSAAGSYAAACAFYTMIFRSNPLEVRFSYDLEEHVAETIRQTVKTVVFDTLSFWLRQTPGDTTSTDTTTIDTTTTDTNSHVGIARPGAFALQASPNPARQHTVVTLQGAAAPMQAVLFDIKGRKLRTILLAEGSNDIRLEDLPRGIYTLAVNGRTLKIVKQ